MSTVTSPRLPQRRTTRHRRHRPIRIAGLAAVRKPQAKPTLEVPESIERHRYETEPEARAFANRDEEAMAILFERHRDKLVRVARQYLVRQAGYRDRVHETDAEDIVQQCYMRVWRFRNGRSHYSHQAPVFIWLRACLYRTFFKMRDHEHYEKRRGSHLTASIDQMKDDTAFEPTGSPDPVVEVQRHEDEERLEHALATLKPKARFIVRKRLEGYGFTEIGAMMEASRQHIHQVYGKAHSIVQASVQGQPVYS